METRNHCSGAGRRGSGERGRERSPGGRRARLWLRSRLFSFFVHYLFRLRPRPCCRSGCSGPAPLARCLPRALGTLCPGQPLGATGKGGDRGGAGTRGGAEGGLLRPAREDPRTLSPPSAWAARPGQRARRWPPFPARTRPSGAWSPVRTRRAPGPQISCPGGPSSVQTFAPAPRARPLQVKPPSARAAARVSLEAPPRGRGTGEAAGFKWGPSGH